MIIGETLKTSVLQQDAYKEYERWKKDNNDPNLPFVEYLDLVGDSSGASVQRWENEIERGMGSDGDGVDGNTMSIRRHVQNGKNKIVFQTANNEYIKADMKNGNMNVVQGKDLAREYNVDEEAYDVIDMNFNSMNFVNLTANGQKDGVSDVVSVKLSKQANIKFVHAEVDPSTPQGRAHLDILFKNKNQWDHDGLLDTTKGSTSQKLKNLLSKILDGDITASTKEAKEIAQEAGKIAQDVKKIFDGASANVKNVKDASKKEALEKEVQVLSELVSKLVENTEKLNELIVKNPIRADKGAAARLKAVAEQLKVKIDTLKSKIDEASK